ncbi:MAG TPA: DEAD/DEAH box helicase [Roseobacter sp.]|uniref:DEAD/DEAH box helicase n=1 Tax=marine sediment metagenome TaxID=412755 RepID=A0A0F9T864_9ZZZZ|nr:DEAD/DEAH box helicase [Roseobacter sp.]
MSETELQDFLFSEGIAPDLDELVRLTATREIENLRPPADAQNERPEWERLLFAGSILARSEQRFHQDAALRIATAALVSEPNLAIQDTAALLLGKLDNHRAVDLALERELIKPDLMERLGLSARMEATRRKLDNSILLAQTGEWLPVNRFQKRFWDAASDSYAWLSASAPTASGKTFLVLQWLMDQLLSNQARIAVYLAPTRALVGEIEQELRAMIGESERIAVTSLPLKEQYDESLKDDHQLVLVLTQERLHLLVNALGGEATFDLMVVDEAHKIGDDQRGVILQDAIERSSRLNPKLKVVFVSPATQNPDALLEDAPDDVKKVPIDSDSATVLQNVISVEQVTRKPKEWYLSTTGSQGEIELGTIHLPSKPDSLKKRLAFIATQVGSMGGTLVYTNGAAEAEDVAQLIREGLPEVAEPDIELSELAEMIRKGIHPKYRLAPLVEQGVAFHYGNMPALIRTQVEQLFRCGKIRFLVCTSTLIEGVNLSCRTIVMRAPRKGKGKPMNPHDFWNLAGRAGRWGDEFQGNIICIEPSDESGWPGGIPRRTRYPIKRETDAVLDESTELREFIERRRTEMPQDKTRDAKFEQVSSYLLSTYLRLGSIRDAPFAKRHDTFEIAELDASLAKVAATIELPIELIERHPGVNCIGMQSLLDAFRAYDRDIENLLPAPSASVDAYDRTVTIMKRINRDLYPAFAPDGRARLFALMVQNWLKGWSLAHIIRERIKNEKSRGGEKKLPALIRETMDLVEQYARFRAPKYLSAYVDILHFHLHAMDRDDLIDEDMDIGTQLEFGVSSQTLMSLIGLGISRMSATMLYEQMSDDSFDRKQCIEWIVARHEEFEGMGLPQIVIRELRREAGIADGT